MHMRNVPPWLSLLALLGLMQSVMSAQIPTQTYQSITVTGGAVSTIATSTLNPGTGTQPIAKCIIQPITQNIVWLVDATPTPTAGNVIAVGQAMVFNRSPELALLKMVAQGPDALVNVACYPNGIDPQLVGAPVAVLPNGARVNASEITGGTDLTGAAQALSAPQGVLRVQPVGIPDSMLPICNPVRLTNCRSVYTVPGAVR